MSASHATVSVYLSAVSFFLFIRVFPKTDNSGNVCQNYIRFEMCISKHLIKICLRFGK